MVAAPAVHQQSDPAGGRFSISAGRFFINGHAAKIFVATVDDSSIDESSGESTTNLTGRSLIGNSLGIYRNRTVYFFASMGKNPMNEPVFIEPEICL